MIHEDEYVAGNPRFAGSRLLVVLTGCSGGGKSTLLGELSRRGYEVRPEAGRQVVREQMHLGGDGLPWADVLKFAELTASRTMYQFNMAVPQERPIFFDRSLVDLVSHLRLKQLTVPAYLDRAVQLYRYAPSVFVTPPWREIYVNEAERSKTFEEACLEYEALVVGYEAAGYLLVEVPRLEVGKRADFIIERL
ncbi:AAA family ATPase [Mesorhizobium microcysteis]|uniref:AAA family ATPase n=1 Tax=Neoaquamicrobium microcysteis TaxID=2682781 RepID=A0A5D4GT54_9HYPH|nr:AAA family ATPase [Mesorhizobium microcysteis]TYR30455.1 AAA family ATPase [Mesorhizobium microcysteis]